MKNEKILITDLDGTLVKNSRIVEHQDQKTLEMLHKKMKIGIATGRSIKEIEYIENQTAIDADIRIGFNGAMIEMNGETIFEETLSDDALKKILVYIQQKNLVFDALDGKSRIGTHKSADIARLWNMELIEPENLFEELKKKKIYKINIRPEENSDALLEELKTLFPHLAICKSGEKRIEVTPCNITKGHALQLIKEKYGYSIVSIGDSENDVSMFECSDESYCMSHAPQKVQKYANKIVNHFSDLIDLV